MDLLLMITYSTVIAQGRVELHRLPPTLSTNSLYSGTSIPLSTRVQQ